MPTQSTARSLLWTGCTAHFPTPWCRPPPLRSFPHGRNPLTCQISETTQNCHQDEKILLPYNTQGLEADYHQCYQRMFKLEKQQLHHLGGGVGRIVLIQRQRFKHSWEEKKRKEKMYAKESGFKLLLTEGYSKPFRLLKNTSEMRVTASILQQDPNT